MCANPKGGVILNMNNLSRAHESVLKICGPPYLEALKSEAFKPKADNYFRQIVNDKSNQQEPQLSVWQQALSEFESEPCFLTAMDALNAKSSAGIQLGPTVAYEQ